MTNDHGKSGKLERHPLSSSLQFSLCAKNQRNNGADEVKTDALE